MRREDVTCAGSVQAISVDPQSPPMRLEPASGVITIVGGVQTPSTATVVVSRNDLLVRGEAPKTRLEPFGAAAVAGPTAQAVVAASTVCPAFLHERCATLDS